VADTLAIRTRREPRVELVTRFRAPDMPVPCFGDPLRLNQVAWNQPGRHTRSSSQSTARSVSRFVGATSKAA